MKKILWIIVLILILGIVLFVLVPNVFKFNIQLNVANALWALVVVVGLIIIYSIMKHVLEPQTIIQIKINAELSSPNRLKEFFGISNTTFKIETYYYIKNKRNPSVEISPGEKYEFKYDAKKDPVLHEWCKSLMKEAQGTALINAKELFPNAKIILAKLPKIGKNKIISNQDYEYDR